MRREGKVVKSKQVLLDLFAREGYDETEKYFRKRDRKTFNKSMFECCGKPMDGKCHRSDMEFEVGGWSWENDWLEDARELTEIEKLALNMKEG